MQIRNAALLSLALASAATCAEASSFKSLYTFCTRNCHDGTQPIGTPVMDAQGRLYGIAIQGGAKQEGSVFALVPHGPKGKLVFEPVFQFCTRVKCPIGRNPVGGLVVDTEGNLYGVSSASPTRDGGTVFELMPNTHRTEWAAKLLYTFCTNDGPGCPDGLVPGGRLAYAGQASGAPYDGVSPLYGTTGSGGPTNGGTVFQLTRNGESWAEGMVYNFCSQANCADGADPAGDLAIDGSGNIYGVTTFGGAGNQGTVFALSGGASRRAWSFAVLHDFCTTPECADGKQPTAGLTLDGAGHLLGTSLGGPTGQGLIFKLTPQGPGSPFQVLYDFCSEAGCSDGAAPTNPLLVDASGNLFGATSEGGHDGSGTVFKFGTGGRLKTLYAFCESGGQCPDGQTPGGGLAMDGAGNLVGTTVYGSDTHSAQGGTIFQVRP